MSARITNEVREELAELIEDGKLDRHKVFEFAAENEDSAIRGYFDQLGAFDPERAVREYGLIVAQRLIMRVRVSIPTGAGTTTRVRGYVSLADDREDGGGYRDTISILSDEVMLARLEETFRRDLRAFEKRYQALESLSKYSPVFNAIREVARKDDESEVA